MILGTTTATGLPDDLFSQQEQRWLGVQVQGHAEEARVLLVSVPYALKAHEAETLGGFSASSFVRATPSGPQVRQMPPGHRSGCATGSTASGSGPAVDLGAAWKRRITATFIPSVMPPDILRTSVMFQSGGMIGIGTTTPTQPLEVLSNSSTNLAVIEAFLTATSGRWQA